MYDTKFSCAIKAHFQHHVCHRSLFYLLRRPMSCGCVAVNSLLLRFDETRSRGYIFVTV